MKEELWLKQMKERLNDYSEPLPVAGWEQLEKDLQAVPKPMVAKRVPLYRRWSVVAAAALLLAVSSVSIWLMRSSLSQEIQQAATSAALAHREQAVQLPVQEVVPTIQEVSAVVSGVAPEQRRSLVIAEEIESSSQHVASNFEKDLLFLGEKVSISENDESLKEVDVVQSSDTVEEDVAEHRSSERYRPSSRDKYHLPVSIEADRSHDRWSFALAVGNTGGLSSSGAEASPTRMYSDGMVLSSDGKFDLSATSQEILQIPSEQELVFNDGLPYLRGTRHSVVSAHHKQPVSVGFSVRKILSKGFSVETGLSYTYLSSDLTMLGGEEFKQKLHYVGIPLRANWSFLNQDRFELYVSAGGAVEKCVYGKLGTESQTVKPLQWSVMGAVGAQLNVSQRVGIYLEPGVSYYFDDGSQVETIRKENPCNFTLQGGIRFTY